MTSGEKQDEQVPHVCVIGAGVCGLVSVKICLESKLRVTCYDKSFKYGGLWNYRPDVEDLQAPFEPSVMRTTILNTSKELSSFSDFPPPPTVANFMRHDYYMAYINSYAQHFKLLPHIQLGHEIISCSPRWELPQDCNSNGRIKWLVRVRNLTSQEVSETSYDRLMVAVGHHNIPFEPSYPNQARFKGRVLHSARLKNILTNQLFVDKRVLVVGFGNSACDAANDIAMVANKCYVSCHRGQWFTGRLLRDEPYDFKIKSRAHHYLTKCLPTQLIDRAIIQRVEERVNHKLMGLQPKHKPSEQVPAINDLFPYRVYTGGIVLKGSVKEFTETGVVFDGEEGQEQPIDLVVMATGYEAKISFLDELQLGLRSSQHNNEYDLFLNIFAPRFKLPIESIKGGDAGELNKSISPLSLDGGASKPLDKMPTPWEAIKSLAFIGLVQPNGSLTVISELQARYATLVFRGDKELPPMGEMLKHMEMVRKMRSKSIRSHSRDQLIGSYVGYMETLAQLIGVRPNLVKLFFADHKLWRHLMFGPCVPYQYRLTGPGCWPEARATVLTTPERVYCGINEGKNHILYKSRRKRLSKLNSNSNGQSTKSMNSTK